MVATILMTVILAAPPQPRFAELKPPVPKFHTTPMPATEWLAQVVDNVTIELPVPEETEYQRVAPVNYKTPVPSKAVPKWCPAKPERLHGYACNMQQMVEDLAGHLQSVHGETLERLNMIGRGTWQDLHDDIHWAKESDERVELFLNPSKAAAKPTVKSGCGPNGCPTQQSYGLFRRWR